MGKTSLVLRLTAFAQQQEYYTVKVEFRQIDRLCLSDLNHFLHYFCWRIAKELGIKPNSDDNWDEEIGSNVSCFLYLKNNLFAQINSSLVLVLEQVDCLFEYPQIAQEFFLLLRSCYEEAQQDTNWLETQTSSSLLYRSNGLYRHNPLPIQYWITITFERIYYSARREKKMTRRKK